MIQTLAELLNDFITSEVDLLNKYEMKHPTTIGTMFEGLRTKYLRKQFFQDSI